MNKLSQSLFHASRGAFFLATACIVAAPVFAEEPIVNFSGDHYLPAGAAAGDVELANAPKAGWSATRILHRLAPASPVFNYEGPEFLLGYEVKASAASNLTVSPEKAVVEDNFQNGNTQRNDTICVTAYGDWPQDNLYSVAALVVFPAKKFDLTMLSYSALNWTENKSYNDKLRHRWVVQTRGKYYINAAFLGRTGVRSSPQGPLDEISSMRISSSFDRWLPYDPAASIFADFNGTWTPLGAALDEVTAVGFYMDAVDFNGSGHGKRQWQLRLITFKAEGNLAPSAGSAR